MTTIPEIRRVPNRGTPSMLWGRTHCDKTLLGPINTKTVADNQHPPQIPPMPRQIGNISLGDHDPICVLGKGGAGEIHLVQPRDGGAPLVCKRPVLNGEDPEDIKNSVRWDGIIGFIAGGHKNIVGGLGCSEKGDNLESYFELVEGVNLDKFIRNTPGRKIAPELARAIILEVCDGLQFLHELPVVHRDIKPGNIMVNMTEEGELITVKLIDFGLAQIMDDVTRTEDEERVGMIFGSLGYWSPEQVLGKTVDARSDIYSLGVTLLKMVTGKNYFIANNQNASLYRTLLRDVPKRFWKGVPEDLKTIIKRMIAKEPEDRFQSCREVSDALKAAKF